jgi:Ricin-type beta-trefoil lectin domain-like
MHRNSPQPYTPLTRKDPEQVSRSILAWRRTAALLLGLATVTLTGGAQAEAAAPYFELVARHSGKCLDVAHISEEDGADVLQGTCWGGPNQHWWLRSVGNGYYEIVARHSGKCLDVAGASQDHAADVIQWTCAGVPNQQWQFRHVGSGYYDIVARHSGKCLDVAYASQAHAANVIQGTCWGGANQRWTLRARA